MTLRNTIWVLLLVTLVARVDTADAQPAARQDSLALSLPAAVARAMHNSEEVQLARSQVELAGAQVRDALSAALPQVSGRAGYTRTLASQFDTGTGFTIPDSLRFEPDPTAPIGERVTYLEDHVPGAGFAALGQLFSDLPFGQENAYNFGFSGSQLLFAGGRVSAGLRIAHKVEDAASYNLREQVASIELDVRSAYYQALYAQELVGISAEALERAQRFLDEEKLRLKAGRASDLDVMRAEVALENSRPQLVQARNAADLALLNLKRLTNVPLSRPIRLTTPLAPPSAEDAADVHVAPELLVAQRASMRAADEQVDIRAGQVRLAKAADMPTVSLTTSYGRQLYPSSIFAFDNGWRTDWTVGVSLQVPLFSGFRRSAQVQVAQVQYRQARLQRDQLREAIQLQYEQALGEKQRAYAQIQARQHTVDQARRVYDLTQMRYEKGLATQLDVFSAQLSLNQARTNLAQALTDYYVADASLDRAMGGTASTGQPSGRDDTGAGRGAPDANRPK